MSTKTGIKGVGLVALCYYNKHLRCPTSKGRIGKVDWAHRFEDSNMCLMDLVSLGQKAAHCVGTAWRKWLGYLAAGKDR